MSFGTIHPNLYKTSGKEVKSSFKTVNNLNVINSKSILFFVSFLVLGSILVSHAFAASAYIVDVKNFNDTSNRIVRTGGGAILQFNVTNQPGSTDNLAFINITNGTTGTSGYTVTSVGTPSSGSCTRNTLAVNCTGLAITPGNSFLVNLTAATPTAGNSGVGRWQIDVNDSVSFISNTSVYTLAIDTGDIGFDIRDELNNATNVSNSARVTIFSPGSSALVLNNASIVDDGTGGDGASDGLVLFDKGTNITSTGATTFSFNISRQGFVNLTSTGNSYSDTGYNPFKPTGIQYGIKVTVQDELGNPVTDATVNVSAGNITNTFLPGNSTTNYNATVGGVYYFALDNAATNNYTNVTIGVTRAGFVSNNSGGGIGGCGCGGTYFMVFPFNLTQQTGKSAYKLPFVLKVNVSDELLQVGPFSNTTGVTIMLNNTPMTANQTSTNFFYFAIGNSSVNVSAAKSGYINTTNISSVLNSTNQTTLNPQLQFRLKVSVQDELGNGQGMGSGVNIAFNTTARTANATSNGTASSVLYFNTTESAVNVSAARVGYINLTNSTTFALNDSTQATAIMRLNFSIKVIGICNELGSAGHCFVIDGVNSSVEVSGNGNTNSTYSGNVSYINATNGPSATSITLNASKNGYVNRSITIITNQTTPAVVMFNATGGTGTTDRASGLLFTVKVLGVFDELGHRNFTLDGTTAAIDVGQYQPEAPKDVFYSGVFAYANATGTSALNITAYMVNQSYVNVSQLVTPSASYQWTVLYNATNTSLNANITPSGLPFILRITLQDERSQTTNMNSGVTVSINGTDYAANDTSTNSYFFTNVTGATNGSGSSSNGAMVINVSRSGYINNTANSVAINSTVQSNITIKLSFVARYAIVDQLANNLTANASGTTFYVNGTSANGTANFTDANYAYFAFTTPGALYVNASVPGYVDNGSLYIDPINATTQSALRNITVNFTIMVQSICDELNVTCLTIDGSTAVVNSGGAEATGGVAGRGATNFTTYNGGRAYINATNGTNINVTAFGDGFINRTGTGVTPNARNQTVVVFNTSALGIASSHVNASAMLFSLRVVSACDELNFTCLSLNGSIDRIGFGASNVNGTSLTGGNITRYNSGRAYISASGTGPGRTPSAVIINASGVGYINATNSSVTPNVNSQVDVIFNASTTPLKYSVKLTLVDELGNTGNMNNATTLHVNLTTGSSTILTENVSFFRTGTSSNIYYINASNSVGGSGTFGIINITAKRDGYINTTYGGTAGTQVNTTVQATPTIRMPFSVKVNSGSVTGAKAAITTGSGTSFIAFDGNSTTDTNSTKDGFIYWALNQTAVVGATGAGTVTLTVSKLPSFDALTFTGMGLNYTTQLSSTATLVSSIDDSIAPVITLTSPVANVNVTTRTPQITFTVIDNDGGSGIDTSTIATNITGFNFTRDCTVYNSLNISCSYTSNALTDSTNSTITIAAKDNSANAGTNATRNFGVNTLQGVLATLNTSSTSGTADNTYASGWSFTFNITLGSINANATSVNATSVKVANWTQVGGTGTIPTTGNTKMIYTMSNGTSATAYISDTYNTTDTVYPLQDLDAVTQAINGTVTIQVKLPTSTTPGTYKTTFTFGSFNFSLATGGNPS